MAALRLFSKPHGSAANSTEQDSVMLMLPDGSIRIFEKAQRGLLTAEAVLSEYPGMQLSHLESLVSADAPIEAGETYFLTPKRATSAIRPRLTPLSRGDSSQNNSPARYRSPQLPRSPLRVATSGDPLALRNATPGTTNSRPKSESNESLSRLRYESATRGRALSPGCTRIVLVRVPCATATEAASAGAGERSPPVAVCGGVRKSPDLGRGARGGSGIDEDGNEDEDANSPPPLHKSKSDHIRRQSRLSSNGSPSEEADFATNVSLQNGKNRHSSSPLQSRAIFSSPTSTASSATRLGGERRLRAARASPSATPNSFFAEIAALEEEDSKVNSTTPSPTAASTSPPPKDSVRARVLSTLAQLKPRRLRCFTPPSQKSRFMSSSSNGSNGADSDESESAEPWMDERLLVLMTDTRIGQRQLARTRGGGTGPCAGSAQQSEAWKPPSQITWADDAVGECRTVTMQAGEIFSSHQVQRSSSSEYSSPSSRICRGCNGVSSVCSCGLPDSFALPSRSASQGSQGLAVEESERWCAETQEGIQGDAAQGVRRRSYAADYIMPASGQKFMSGPITPRDMIF